MIRAAAQTQSVIQSHAAHLILLGAWLVIVAGAIGRNSWLARRNGAKSEPLVVGLVRSRLTGWLGVVALCTAAAAVIHADVISEHFEEAALFGVFFVMLSVSQLGFAVLLIWRPSTTLLKAGIVASAAVIALWVVSRTVGIPVGPEPGTAESVGVRDVLSTVFELAAALASVPALRTLGYGRLAPGRPAADQVLDRPSLAPIN